MTIYGWDASDFDWARGPMDLGAARRAGISFFTHKATEGTRTKHIHFGEALKRAREAGIPFLGAYIVPRTPGNGGHGGVGAQVDYFLKYVDQQVPWWRDFHGWFWQVDTEHWAYDRVSPQTGNAVCVELKRRTGKYVTHYAPEWAYGGSVPVGPGLWASNYVGGSGQFKGLYPGDRSLRWHAYSGRTPVILQYTSSATIGRQTRCDANAFRGTEAQFASLIGAPTGPHIEQGEDMAKLPFLALHEPTGAVMLCDLMTSRWVASEPHLVDINYLANQLGVDLTAHEGPGDAEWTPEGLRKGWSEEVFGILIGPRPAGLDTPKEESK